MSGKSNETFFDKDSGFKRQHVALLVMPLALILCVTFIMPTDLYSTARWWDQQGWQLVWQDGDVNNPVIDAFERVIPGTASAEGVAFSAAMIMFQLIVTMRIYQEGSWLRSGSPIGLASMSWKIAKGQEKFENVNASKAAWAGVWVFCVLFDAFTSFSYRSTAASATITTLIVHAILVENVLSEIMFGESLRGTINLGVLLLATVKLRQDAVGRRPSPPRQQQPTRPDPQPPRRMPPATTRDSGRSNGGNGANAPLFHAPLPRDGDHEIDDLISRAMNAN